MSGPTWQLPMSTLPIALIRKSDLQAVAGCLRHGHCCSVHGISNSGKSKLLQTLEYKPVQQICSVEGSEPLQAVFIDVSDAEGNEPVFWAVVLRGILASLRGIGWMSPALDELQSLADHLDDLSSVDARSAFENAIERLLAGTSLRLALILDEFDVAYAQLPAPALKKLVALHSSWDGRLLYVIGMCRAFGENHQVARDVEEFDEMFRTRSYWLLPLDQAAAKALLDLFLLQDEVSITDDERQAILALAGGHVGLLELWSSLRQGIEANPGQTLDAWAADLLGDEVIREEVKRIWEQLNTDDCTDLMMLARHDAAEWSKLPLKRMRGRGLVVGEPASPNVFSPIFWAYVQTQVVEEMTYDLATSRVWIGKREVTWDLRGKQRKFLLALCQQDAQGGDGVLTYDEIQLEVYQERAVAEDAAGRDHDHARIRQLCRQVELKLNTNLDYIVAVDGEGYRLNKRPKPRAQAG